MNIRTLAAAAALTLAATAPAAGAHRRNAGAHPQPALVRSLIAEYFPAGQHARAFRVAACESGLDPNALNHNRNGTHDWGVFQINDGGTMQGLGLSRADALDARLNVAAAAHLWRKRGWRPWYCSGRSR